MKKIGITCLLFLIAWVGYSQSSGKQKSTLRINTFTDLPKEIEGCGSYFYLSKNDKKLNRYIFVNDFAKYAFIKIGDKLEKFSLVKNFAIGKMKVYLYQSKSAQLKIEVKSQKATGSENAQVAGTMTVQSSDGQKATMDFIGDLGC